MRDREGEERKSAEGAPKRWKGSAGGRVAFNSAVGMGARAFYIASRLALTPFILHHVPLDEFGLWSICFVILSYAGLGVFGINNAYVRYTAQYYAQGRPEQISRIVSTGVISMSLFCLGVFAAIALLMPFLMNHFSIDPHLRDLAKVLIVGTAFAFLLDLALGGFRGALEGLQEIALIQFVWLLVTSLEVGLIAAFLLWGTGVTGLLYAYLIKTLVEMGACTVLAFVKLPELRVGVRFFSKESLRELFGFGSKIQILGFLGIFMNTFDRLAATAIVGLEAAGIIEIGRKFPFSGRSISQSAANPLMPAASSLGGRWENESRYAPRQRTGLYVNLALLSLLGAAATLIPGWIALWTGTGLKPALTGFLSNGYGPIVLITLALCFWPGGMLLKRVKPFVLQGEYVSNPELKGIYLNGCRHINLINGVLFMFLIIIAPSLVFGWVGEGYAGAAEVMMVFAASNLVHLATGPGSLMLRGLDRSGKEFEYTIIRVVLALVWTPFLAWRWGVVGAVLGTGVATAAGSVYFLYRSNKAFHVSAMEYARNALTPLTAPAASAVLIWAGLSFFPPLSRWETLAQVVVAGVVYVLLTGLFLKLWVLSPRETELLAKPLKRRRR